MNNLIKMLKETSTDIIYRVVYINRNSKVVRVNKVGGFIGRKVYEFNPKKTTYIREKRGKRNADAESVKDL